MVPPIAPPVVTPAAVRSKTEISPFKNPALRDRQKSDRLALRFGNNAVFFPAMRLSPYEKVDRQVEAQSASVEGEVTAPARDPAALTKLGQVTLGGRQARGGAYLAQIFWAQAGCPHPHSMSGLPA
jgi:hypothetical protein